MTWISCSSFPHDNHWNFDICVSCPELAQRECARKERTVHCNKPLTLRRFLSLAASCGDCQHDSCTARWVFCLLCRRVSLTLFLRHSPSHTPFLIHHRFQIKSYAVIFEYALEVTPGIIAALLIGLLEILSRHRQTRHWPCPSRDLTCLCYLEASSHSHRFDNFITLLEHCGQSIVLYSSSLPP